MTEENQPGAYSRANADLLRALSNPRREERSYSLLDLIEREMFDVELAAWCVAQVAGGASFITGAGPGGVGKTTAMRALLAFAPDDRQWVEALPGQVGQLGGVPQCAISHEVSDHSPPTYLWDQDVRDFFALGAAGHTLVANMHADELAEVEQQIVGENQVPQAHFRAVDLFIFIGIEGEDLGARRINNPTARRYIRQIYYSDGSAPHRAVLAAPEVLDQGAPRRPAAEERCRAFLQDALGQSQGRVEGVRRAFLARF